MDLGFGQTSRSSCRSSASPRISCREQHAQHPGVTVKTAKTRTTKEKERLAEGNRENTLQYHTSWLDDRRGNMRTQDRSGEALTISSTGKSVGGYK